MHRIWECIIYRSEIKFKYAKLRRSYEQILRNWLKRWFLAENGHFLPKWVKNGQTGFLGKIQKCHFRRIRKPQLSAKNQKIPMNGFWDLSRTDKRTDERTNERTPERESIGRSANAERPINSVHITKLDHTTSIYWMEYAKNLRKHHFVTTRNVFLTQKGPKRPKRDFSRNIHWVISYIDPKYSLNMQN